MELISNPIIRRELITHLRKGRTLGYLFLFLLAMLALYSLVYAWAITAWTIEQHDGRQIFFPVIYFSLLIAVPLSTLAAGSLVREREEDSLDLLITTPLKHRSILLGKVVATLIYSLLIFSALLPFLAIAFVVGGLSSVEACECLFTLLGFYTVVTVIGVSVSLLSVTAHAASRTTIMMILLLYFGTLTARIIFYDSMNTRFSQRFWGLDLLINPLVAIFLVHNPTNINRWMLFSMIGGKPDNSWSNTLYQAAIASPGTVCGLGNLLLAGVLFAATAILFRRFSNQLSTRFTYKDFFPRIRRRILRLRKTTSFDHGLPLFGEHWKAVHQRESLSLNRKIMSREKILLPGAVVISTGITWFALHLINPQSRQVPVYMIHIMLSLFGVVFAGLYAPIPASYALLSEYRSRTWELLRTTNLSSLHIIAGKTLSGWRQSALPLLCVIISYYLTFVLFFVVKRGGLPEYAVTHVLVLTFFFSACMYFYSALGVYYSSLSRRRPGSPHRKTFMVVAFHYLLPYFVYLVVNMLMTISFPRPRREVRIMFSNITHQMETYLLPISPWWIFSQWSWGIREVLIILTHGAILCTFGFFLMYAAAAEIKKKDD